MEFSFMHQARTAQVPNANQTPEENQDPQSIASERLRKAIERNRRRTQSSSSAPRASFQQPQQFSAGIGTTSNLADSEEIVHAEFVESIVPPPHRERERKIRTSYSQEKTASTATSTSSRPLVQSKWTEYLIKGGWIFCGILLLRLVFADRGIIDFIKMKNVLDTRQAELESIQRENQQTLTDIERIQKDKLFQRQLIRDNLGFIASDEYLVLFGKDNLLTN